MQFDWLLRKQTVRCLCSLAIILAPIRSQNVGSQDSFESLLAKAKQGNAVAQNNLGVALETKKDFANAAAWFKLAADQGLAVAQANLGALYLSGKGVEKDYAAALYWSKLAATQSVAIAQNNLGAINFNALGAPKDYAEALRWFRLAADQEFAPAQSNLGQMYRDGDGVTKDYDLALHWIQLAANQNLPDAQSNLGEMYMQGFGVKQDLTEGRRLLTLAANGGSARGQLLLGAVYADGGLGVAPPDYVQGYMWILLASFNEPDDSDIASARDEVKAKMTPAQIETASRLAREWTPQLQTSANIPSSPPAAELPAHERPSPHAVPEIPPSIAQPSKESPGFTWPSWFYDQNLRSTGLVIVVFMLFFGVRTWLNPLSATPPKLGRDRDGFQQAQTGVPHAGFRPIKNGFEVALKNKASSFDGLVKVFFRSDNHIQVTTSAITINGKRLRPSEFRGFANGGFDSPQNQEACLGYYYGSEVHWLPGVWTPQQAQEIVLAMNLHFRALFQAEAQTNTRTDPEQLRNTRPTDF